MNATKCAATAILIACGLTFAPHARADTAQEMAGYCEPYRTAVVTKPGEVSVPTRDLNSQYCWGAFAAVQEFYVQGDLGLCLPERSSRLELVKVFIRYMDQHPNTGHERFGRVLLLAMADAFPCPKKPVGSAQ
jgi:hypothetical protein